MFWLLLFLLPLVLPQRCPENSDLTNYMLYGRSYGNCAYLIPSKTYASAKQFCLQHNLTLININNAGENSQAQALLFFSNRDKAFIGYIQNGNKWLTDSGAVPSFEKFGSSSGGDCTTTLAPALTTVPSNEQRRPTNVVFMIDSSFFSSAAFTFNEAYLVQLLATHIYQYGPAKYAYMFYGCNNYTSSPYYAYSDFMKQLASLNQSLIECTRTNPFTFARAMNVLTVNYYSVNPVAGRPYTYTAVVIFSSISDPSVVSNALHPSSPSHSQIIGVSVGSSAVSLKSIASPAGNTLSILNFNNMSNLVTKIDNMIFNTNLVSTYSMKQNNEILDSEPRILDSNYDTATTCGVLNALDGNWYPASCDETLDTICLGSALPSGPLPTGEPFFSLCSSQFAYFDDLDNVNCYIVSEDLQNFSSSVSQCYPSLRHKAQLSMISIHGYEQNRKMQDVIASSDSAYGHGLFWIGLQQISSQMDDSCYGTNNITVAQTCWQWLNGEEVDYVNFRSGYPRRGVTDSLCVAYVYDDGSWVTTDCSQELYPLCYYRFM